MTRSLKLCPWPLGTKKLGDGGCFCFKTSENGFWKTVNLGSNIKNNIVHDYLFGFPGFACTRW